MDNVTNISINNIPNSKRTEVGYRTITNSGEVNELQGEILSDILDLFNKANRMEKEIEEAKTVIGVENMYLQYRITDLETKLATITQRYKDLTASDPNASRTIIRYPNEMYVDGSEYSAFIDLENLDVTMQPSITVSKANLYDEALKATFVPPSLKLETGPETFQVGGAIIEIEDNKLSNAFDGDDTSYWVRKVVTDNTIDSVTTELIIGLPEDIITTRDINTIIINPYPVNAVDVLSVEYKENGSWVQLDAFKSHRCSVLENYTDIFGNTFTRPAINDCPNIKLCFKSINANQLRITLRQRHFIQGENNTRAFFLGAKNIEILQNSYMKEYCTFNAVVEFPEINNTIIVKDTELVLNNASETLFNTVQYEYFYYDSNDKPHKILETAPFSLQGHKMLIKFKMHNEYVTPNIAMIKVKYKVI
jgi:hypothetical protein